MRWRACAGSLSMSLYWGRNIFPSFFLGSGYDGDGRSTAMSALLEYRLVWNPLNESPSGDRLPSAAPTPASGLPWFAFAIRFVLLFMLDRLGRPKSSPSSSS